MIELLKVKEETGPGGRHISLKIKEEKRKFSSSVNTFSVHFSDFKMNEKF